VLQNHARETRTPIDRLSLAFRVLPGACSGPQDVGPGLVPEDGVLVHGLLLEGASWDEQAGCLAPAAPGQLHCQLPVVHFLPVANRADRAEGLYACPLYKTQARAGALSTTGHSTNFVLHMALPIAQGSRADDWVVQGTAALCSLSG
jgi:dynein heavy chain